MTGLKARSLAAALAASAMSAAAFVAPGTASAACTGANIKANGSSLQAAAQQKIWSPAFNAACKESNTEQVEYESTSSGKGLASWGVGKVAEKFKGFGASNAFVGTDQPPNETQEKEILENQSPVSTKVVLTIPVLQAAVALAVHLPEGCTAEGGKKGVVKRLILSDLQLQGIFAHTVTKWTEVTGVKCSESAKTEITRVVRKEGSGTSALVKKFLFAINKEPVDGSKTWNALAEEDENLEWPAETEGLVRAEKGSGIASTVVSTSGSIGYANLNEVRANKAFTPEGGGGEGEPIFWAELQSKGKKFEDPSTNGEANTAANANCAGETYITLNKTGKEGKFPPPSTEAVWNEVTASIVQKKSYPLCGFTYDLTLEDYANFSSEAHPTTAAEVETVKNYFTFLTSEAQQKALEGKDFLGLPVGKKAGNVLLTAQQGVSKIAFE